MCPNYDAYAIFAVCFVILAKGLCRAWAHYESCKPIQGVNYAVDSNCYSSRTLAARFDRKHWRWPYSPASASGSDRIHLRLARQAPGPSLISDYADGMVSAHEQDGRP